MNTCSKCKYFSPHTDVSYTGGSCHRLPPVCISTDVLAFNWVRPVVYQQDTVCKHYKRGK